MSFIEAVYGSQYLELVEKGKDGSKGRFNGNILLTAFIITALLTVIALWVVLGDLLNGPEKGPFRFKNSYLSGSAIGKIGALIVFGMLYFGISRTIGSVASYNSVVSRFVALPEEVRKKANSRVIIPFFILTGLLTICLFSSLGNLV